MATPRKTTRAKTPRAKSAKPRRSAKASTLKFADLSPEEQRIAAGKIARTALGVARRAQYMNRGEYEAVTWPYSTQRAPSSVERSGEDQQLTPAERHRLVNLTRRMMRNSTTRLTQDQQLRVNVVGSCGGKMYASFPEGFEDAAGEVMDYFNREWFPRAEYTFRKNFNWLLKTVLTSEDTSGNVILVFDDGILTGGDGTGRIRGFEGDEIASVSDARFAALFPAGHSQSAGFVYNPSGMFCGAFVSTSHRGETIFPDGSFITLRIDPFDDSDDPNWICLGDMRRFNQGRAVSPLVSALTTLTDLHEICASERQGAKLNAQLVGQILSDASAESAMPLAFEDETDDDDTSATKEFTTKELSAIGAHFDQMPEGMKIDLLDTKRPNPNMPAYIEFLTGQVGGVRGLARVYATLKAQTSYTAFRGEQVMTEPSFEEARQDLEREVCDWAARHVIRRAVSLGFIRSALPEGWERMLAWNWPKMPEVSEKDAQAALQLKLNNGVTSLTRELGPGEVDKIIAERRRERKLFDDAGLIYPGTTTVSGTMLEGNTSEDPSNSNEESDNNE